MTAAVEERHAIEAAKRQLRLGCPKSALIILAIHVEAVAARKKVAK